MAHARRTAKKKLRCFQTKRGRVCIPVKKTRRAR